MKILRVKELNGLNEFYEYIIFEDKSDFIEAEGINYVDEFGNEVVLKEVCKDVPIADAILKAIAKGEEDFAVNETGHCIDKYEYYPNGESMNPYINHIFKEYTLNDDIIEIIIFKTTCTCKICYNKFSYRSIDNIKIRVPAYGMEDKLYEIDVQHCRHCGRFFINESSLTMYEKRYKVALFVRRISEESSDKSEKSKYNKDSVLSRHGYSAGQNCPSDRERQGILTYLIESKTSSKAEIKQILGGFIINREQNCPYATKIWEKDLEYVNDYEYFSKKLPNTGNLVRNKV